MDAVAAWHEEHSYFGRLLHLLQEEVDMLHAGARPNYELMLDILAYLREYGDRMHHPREDEAFRRLAQRNPRLRKIVWRLHQEHRIIAQAGEALATLLEDAVNDAMLSRQQIEVAAATYIVYYGTHIAREEEDVLPAAVRDLTDEDWAAARSEGLAAGDPLRGRFRAMRRRIALEAV
jgi:hemerythrin-like domain-containing protein